MKKLIALFAGLLFSSATLFGQGTEMGVRFYGGDYDLGAALDMAFPTSRTNRIHCDVGIGGNGVVGNVLYDWLFPIPELPELVFYPGVGGGFYVGEYGFNAALVGELGLEYGFDFPLTIGFDIRPRFDFIENAGIHGQGALVARYRF